MILNIVQLKDMALLNEMGKMIVFLFLLLSIYLISERHRITVPNYLFAAFLLVSLIDLSGLFIPTPALRVPRAVWTASELLQLPIYYLYLKTKCRPDLALKKTELVHGLPFLFFFCLFGIFGIHGPGSQLFEVISISQYYGYIIGIFMLLDTFRKLAKVNHYGQQQLSYHSVILILIGNFFVLIRGILSVENQTVLYLYAACSLLTLIAVGWCIGNVLSRPGPVGVQEKAQDQSTPLNHHQDESEQLKLLLEFMHREKPYADDKLTMHKLALQIDMQEKSLSILINQHTGKHFFDFINEFRINDAKKLLRDELGLTVLEILYKVGFNSRSSFYTAFKKATKLTPTEYRKSVT